MNWFIILIFKLCLEFSFIVPACIEEKVLFCINFSFFIHFIDAIVIFIDFFAIFLFVISNTYNKAAHYQNILATESDIAILSHELNALGHCLQELLGIVSPDEVLDHIFANFCIGK